MKAVIEVGIMCVIYIVFAHFAAANISLEKAMPAFLAGTERQIGATFMVGAIAQIIFILICSLILIDLKRAISHSLKFGNATAWGVALISIFIHSATVIFFFLNEPGQVLEPSSRNLFLSIVPAFDGWSQEVFFRGYVIFRLMRGGVAIPIVFAVSALSFAAIHIGYIGQDFFSAFWPMVGTAILGAFLTWPVLLARGALLPVIVCHAALIAIVQPWLALA